MKKTLCVLLTVVLLCGTLAAFAPAARAADEAGFTPVFRFIASSDTHVRDDSDVTMERIGKMLALGYAAAEADAGHPALDAVLVCGDLTNDGTKTEFDRFWAAVDGAKRDETRFLGVVAKNHDGYLMSRTELRAYYENLTGNDADFHVVLGGYHFIGVSASPNGAKHYDKKQIDWLRAQLDAAVADDPERPVFVIHHEHNRKTVYGSATYDGWGVRYFKKVLKDYPQVVDFSGHSHYPLNDPRSIWQGEYTAIGTGAIYYSEFTVEGVRCYHPADSNDTATCWIAELDKDHNLRLVGMDVEAGQPLCEYILKNPAKQENREFTPEKRKAACAAPVFPEGAALEVETGYGALTVTAPAVVYDADDPAFLYRAAAIGPLGGKAAKTWVMPCYYRAEGYDSVELTLEGLAAGEYTVRVTAENAYGEASAPLEVKVTVEGDSPIKNLPRRIKLFFKDVKFFFRRLVGLG